MNESIQIAIISAGLATLINCLFQLINKLLDNAKEHRESNSKELATYKERKEKTYIAAIGRLLQIRRGFDYTREMVIHSNQLRDYIEKENKAFAEISPQLRLYSSDTIFNKYHELATYARFSYAPQNGPRLFENSKWAYDMQITLLARLMQEDLGYRKYNIQHDMIICPECSCEHDIVSNCPRCGMTYSQLQKKAQEILNQMQEMQNNEDSNEEISKDI